MQSVIKFEKYVHLTINHAKIHYTCNVLHKIDRYEFKDRIIAH